MKPSRKSRRAGPAPAPRTSALALLCALAAAMPAPGRAQLGEGWHNSVVDITAPPGGGLASDSAAPPAASESSSATRDPGGMGELDAGGPAAPDEITPEIQALADGLERDPMRIFNYVRNQIDYEHYHGCKKGAMLTLLEGAGNDMDQCTLLVALLRASGVTAEYDFARQAVPYAGNGGNNIVDWMGLSTNAFPQYTVQDFLNAGWPQPPPGVTDQDYKNTIWGYFFLKNGGTPYAEIVNDGTWSRLRFYRTLVSASIDGADRRLDPSFKRYESVGGADLATATGLTRTSLLAAAGGGTGSPDWVQNLSDGALANKLAQGCTNLLGWLETNRPDATVAEITSGRRIIPLEITNWAQASPLPGPDIALGMGGSMDPRWLAKLRVTFPGADKTFNFCELQGRRLSLSFSNDTAMLWLDDTNVVSGNVGSTFDLVLAADHPHGTMDPWANFIDTGAHDQALTNSFRRADTYRYALIYGFSPSVRWLRHRQARLDSYLRQGLADDSRQVVSESLNIMGLNWLVQTALSDRLLYSLRGIAPLTHHAGGRMAQEDYFYVDVGLILTGVRSRDGDPGHLSTGYLLGAHFGSALEHGVIEQMQGDSNEALSTMKIIKLANANGRKIYRATSANWNSVKNQLNNYSNGDKNAIEAQVNAGAAVLLPQNGATTLNQWSGVGYAAIHDSGGLSALMKISGGLHGGFNSTQGYVRPDPIVTWRLNDPVALNASSSFAFNNPLPNFAIPQIHASDPVNMANGAFEYEKSDLAIDASTRRPLLFARHYDSNRRDHDPAALGHGWTHNWMASAARRTAAEAGLGLSDPFEMAPYLTAAAAALMVYDGAATAKDWATAALITAWGVDQLRNNAVSVTLGKDTLQFIKMPDGAFRPPAGATHSLSLANGKYRMQERNGRAFQFRDDGKLDYIADPYDKRVNLTYDGEGRVDLVAKDAPGADPVLDFSYHNGRLVSVTARATPPQGGPEAARTVVFTPGAGAQSNDLAAATDPDGHAWAFLYDSEHRITELRDPLGRPITRNEYDAESRVVRQFSQGDTNRAWRMFYSGRANVEVDPTGARRLFTYDERGRATGATDALGNFSSMKYDGQSRIVQTTAPDGGTSLAVFDRFHNLLRARDALGVWTTNSYDSLHRLVSVRDGRGNLTRMGYNAKHQVVGVTNAAAEVVRMVYDAASGDLLSVTTGPDAPGGPVFTTTYSYGASGRHLPVGVAHPGGYAESMAYNAWGELSSHTDRRGQTTTTEYNGRGGVVRVVAPLGAVVSNLYDPAGNLVQTINPRGFGAVATFNAIKKPLATTLPATEAGAAVVSNLYDVRDLPVGTAGPLGTGGSAGYDAAQRVVRRTDALGRTVASGYDAAGRVVAVTNALGFVTRQAWNARGEMTSITDALNNAVRYRYDAAGNRTAITNRLGHDWEFVFDPANRVQRMVSPLGRETVTEYNGRGLPARVTEPSGQQATLLYDGLGRLTNRTDPAGSTSWTYDGEGNPLTVREGTNVLARAFDALGRVANFVDASGNRIGYAYDVAGNLTNLVYPGGLAVRCAYDSEDRLSSVIDWSNRVTALHYDLAGRLERIDRWNGTARTMKYDAASQLLEIREEGPEGLIAMRRFMYDNGGRLKTAFMVPLPPTNVPPLAVTATYDADNRMVTANGESMVHDADGNLTVDAVHDRSHLWDARNRLVGTTNNGQQTTINHYDPEGNRVTMIHGTETNRYVVDPNVGMSRVLVRQRPDGTKVHGVYAGSTLLYEITSAGTTGEVARVFHTDQIGSTLALTDAAGKVTDRAMYDPYGRMIQREGTSDTPYWFVGTLGVMSDPSGLLSMRARFYDPGLRRFLSEDPLGFGAGMNSFAYANSNPVTVMDPTGNIPLPVITGGIGAIVGGAFGGFAAAFDDDPRTSVIGGVAGGVVSGAIIGSGAALIGAGSVGGVAGLAALGAGGGATGEAAGQLTDIMAGSRTVFDGGGIAKASVINAVLTPAFGVAGRALSTSGQAAVNGILNRGEAEFLDFAANRGVTRAGAMLQELYLERAIGVERAFGAVDYALFRGTSPVAAASGEVAELFAGGVWDNVFAAPAMGYGPITPGGVPVWSPSNPPWSPLSSGSRRNGKP